MIFVWRPETFILCAMSQGKNVQKLQTIFSLLSTKTVRKLQAIFHSLMKTTTTFSNINKNCLQETFCVCDYVAVSRCFCYGGLRECKPYLLNSFFQILFNCDWASPPSPFSLSIFRKIFNLLITFSGFSWTKQISSLIFFCCCFTGFNSGKIVETDSSEVEEEENPRIETEVIIYMHKKNRH